MTPPTVLEMVRAHLVAHGYDGLYCDGCGCRLADLAPCADAFGSCQAGYLCDCDPETCEAGGGCAWHVGPERRAT